MKAEQILPDFKRALDRFNEAIFVNRLNGYTSAFVR